MKVNTINIGAIVLLLISFFCVSLVSSNTKDETTTHGATEVVPVAATKDTTNAAETYLENDNKATTEEDIANISGATVGKETDEVPDRRRPIISFVKENDNNRDAISSVVDSISDSIPSLGRLLNETLVTTMEPLPKVSTLAMSFYLPRFSKAKTTTLLKLYNSRNLRPTASSIKNLSEAKTPNFISSLFVVPTQINETSHQIYPTKSVDKDVSTRNKNGSRSATSEIGTKASFFLGILSTRSSIPTEKNHETESESNFSSFLSSTASKSSSKKSFTTVKSTISSNENTVKEEKQRTKSNVTSNSVVRDIINRSTLLEYKPSTAPKTPKVVRYPPLKLHHEPSSATRAVSSSALPSRKSVSEATKHNHNHHTRFQSHNAPQRSLQPLSFLGGGGSGPSSRASFSSRSNGFPLRSNHHNVVSTNSGTGFDTSTPTNISAQLGSSAYLPCKIRNLGNKTISWIRSRDSHIISIGLFTFIADERFQLWHEEETDTWTLMIKYVQERDDGRYECQVSTEPKMSHFIHFHVVIPLVRIPGGSDIHVKVGSTVSLKCVISAALKQPDYIFWYQGNERVVSSASGRQIFFNKIANDSSVGTLVIPHASPTDSGVYKCVPEKLNVANVTLHVLNGEHPAAMQHGTSVMTKPASPQLLITTLILIFILDRSLLYHKNSSIYSYRNDAC